MVEESNSLEVPVLDDNIRLGGVHIPMEESEGLEPVERLGGRRSGEIGRTKGPSWQLQHLGDSSSMCF